MKSKEQKANLVDLMDNLPEAMDKAWKTYAQYMDNENHIDHILHTGLPHLNHSLKTAGYPQAPQGRRKDYCSIYMILKRNEINLSFL